MRVDLIRGGAAGMFISVALHAAVAAAAMLASAPKPAPTLAVLAVEVAIVQEAPPNAPSPASPGVGAVGDVAEAPPAEASATERARASFDLPTGQTVNVDRAPLAVTGAVSVVGGGDPLDPYVAQVWSRIAAHRPRGLRGAGDARVVFGLDRAGRVRFARIASSSGSPTFDRACLAAIRAAAPYPPAPTLLDEADLVFEAPMLNERGG